MGLVERSGVVLYSASILKGNNKETRTYLVVYGFIDGYGVRMVYIGKTYRVHER